jgi:hypothetical protein
MFIFGFSFQNKNAPNQVNPAAWKSKMRVYSDGGTLRMEDEHHPQSSTARNTSGKISKPGSPRRRPSLKYTTTNQQFTRAKLYTERW